jgi:hypothetical protein
VIERHRCTLIPTVGAVTMTDRVCCPVCDQPIDASDFTVTEGDRVYYAGCFYDDESET